MTDHRDITVGCLNIWFVPGETPVVERVMYRPAPGHIAVDVWPVIVELGVEWQVAAILKEHGQ